VCGQAGVLSSPLDEGDCVRDKLLPVEADVRVIRSADGTSLGVQTLGSGPGVVVVGGAVRSAQDYLPLARALATRFQVHVLDRRGRGLSGPQGPGYSVDREVEDLVAVSAAVGARRVVGHSFGGLVTLEAARQSSAFEEIVVYEPGVSVRGSIPVDWTGTFTQRLQRGHDRGAFAAFVRGSGQAPPMVAKLPLWYLTVVLRLAVRGESWERIRQVLPTVAPEHLEVARLDDTYQRYADVAARTLLLAGARSPAVTRQTLSLLARTIPGAQLRILEGLDHLAPDDHAPERVAEAALGFLSTDHHPSRAEPSDTAPANQGRLGRC
jgi:pimeloyl-ACP methyl ester carboxylesterase